METDEKRKVDAHHFRKVEKSESAHDTKENHKNGCQCLTGWLECVSRCPVTTSLPQTHDKGNG